MDIACQRDQRMLVDGLRHLRRRRYLSQRGFVAIMPIRLFDKKSLSGRTRWRRGMDSNPWSR